MVRILVGIPCFRVADAVRRCLTSLTCSTVDILAIDNAADQDVKNVLDSFEKISVIHSLTNEWCNGAWNRILEYGIAQEYDIIGLGSSDVTFTFGWEAILRDRFSQYKDEVWLPKVGRPSEGAERVRDEKPGFFSFWPLQAAKLVYPIPKELRQWFGDTYMFRKILSFGWHVTELKRLTSEHEQGLIMAANRVATASVIEQDKKAWQEMA